MRYAYVHDYRVSSRNNCTRAMKIHERIEKYRMQNASIEEVFGLRTNLQKKKRYIQKSQKMGRASLMSLE